MKYLYLCQYGPSDIHPHDYYAISSTEPVQYAGWKYTHIGTFSDKKGAKLYVKLLSKQVANR